MRRMGHAGGFQFSHQPKEVFKDLKGIWSWGKQKLRLLESIAAATVMNMVLFGLVELSTWHRTAEELVDRELRPWDDANRRLNEKGRMNDSSPKHRQGRIDRCSHFRLPSLK